MSTPKSSVKPTGEHVLTMIESVYRLFTETGILFNQYKNEPSSGSIAIQEQKNFPKAELVRDVHYRGILSMEAAADHLVVFADSLTEPSKTVAPWTCVKGLAGGVCDRYMVS
jgi:hypothetical protein